MQDESYIRITLELAQKRRGNIGADPLAGALIVNSGKIFSASFKESNEGVNCCLTAIRNTKRNLQNSTIYTNIEPGSNQTENLTEEIFITGISQIVIGCYDAGFAGDED